MIILTILCFYIGAFLLNKYSTKHGSTESGIKFLNPTNEKELFSLVKFKAILASVYGWGAFFISLIVQYLIIYPHASLIYYLFFSAGGASASVFLMLFPPKYFKSTKESLVFTKTLRYRKLIYKQSFWTILSPLGCYLLSFIKFPDTWTIFYRTMSDTNTVVQMIFIWHTIFSWLLVIGNLDKYLYKNWQQIMENPQSSQTF